MLVTCNKEYYCIPSLSLPKPTVFVGPTTARDEIAGQLGGAGPLVPFQGWGT